MLLPPDLPFQHLWCTIKYTWNSMKPWITIILYMHEKFQGKYHIRCTWRSNLNNLSPTEWKMSRLGFEPEALDILTNALTTELSRRYTIHEPWHNSRTCCYHRICHFDSFDVQLSTHVTPWNHETMDNNYIIYAWEVSSWNMIFFEVGGQSWIFFLH